MIETNASGTPRVKISASDIKQDARADTIDMKNVQVDYFGAAPRHWLLTAQYGFIPERTQIVEFAGDVEITEVGVPDTPRIETERLTLDMEKDLAHTDAEVSVNFGPHAVNARGLRADLNAENLRLESSVNGRFQPK